MLNSLIFVLLVLVVILVVAYVAKYLVDTFFPAPLHVPLLALVGIILLIAVLWTVSAHFGIGVLR
jgi:hypothetical protein